MEKGCGLGKVSESPSPTSELLRVAFEAPSYFTQLQVSSEWKGNLGSFVRGMCL